MLVTVVSLKIYLPLKYLQQQEAKIELNLGNKMIKIVFEKIFFSTKAQNEDKSESIWVPLGNCGMYNLRWAPNSSLPYVYTLGNPLPLEFR